MQKLSRKKHSAGELFSSADKSAAGITARRARHTNGEVITMSSKKNKNNGQNDPQAKNQNKSQNNSQNNTQNKSQNSSQN